MTNSKDSRGACWSALKSVSRKRSRGGPGFCSLLGLMFIGLKLTDHIDWSWWWVLAPLWIPGVLVLLVIAVIIIVAKRTGWESSGES